MPEKLEIADFSPFEEQTRLGVAYDVWQYTNGPRLWLSRSGHEKIEADPAFATLVTQTANFLSDQPAQTAAKNIGPTLGLELKKHSINPQRSWVHCPLAQPEIITKISTVHYDSQTQFMLMNFFASKFDGNFRAATQYAWLQNQNGANVTFMQNMPGTLFNALPVAEQTERLLSIRAEIIATLGRTGLGLLNDIGEQGHHNNLLIAGDMTYFIDNPVTDQLHQRRAIFGNLLLAGIADRL